jgi:hypothetical protein
MPLPLPKLDDRRWQDLTQEAIPLIPRYAPQWTDFNAHDPGVTLMEMFAWLSEAMVFQLNQVPDRFIWGFLEFIGYPKEGPLPARAVITFGDLPPGTSFEAPIGVQFRAQGASGQAVIFATERPIDLQPVVLAALQTDHGTGILADASLDLTDGLPFAAFGPDPVVGSALYLGFDTLPTGSPVALWLRVTGPGSGDAAERARIKAEAAAQAASCRAPPPGWSCAPQAPAGAPACDCAGNEPRGPVPPHHSAQVVWEVLAGGSWVPLTAQPMPARPAPGEVVDDTRSLTLDGLVEINLPVSSTQAALGAVAAPLYYVRVRLVQGAYDAPVILTSIQPNAVAAAQRAALWRQLVLPAALPPLAPAPAVGQPASATFTLAPDLSVQSLVVQQPPASGSPAFTVLEYAPPMGGAAGSITFDFEVLALGTAVPSQHVQIAEAPVQDQCFQLFTHDGVAWTRWRRVANFQACTRTDVAFTLDPTSGLVVCGDGERGQVFPQSSTIVAAGFATLGDQGNVRTGRIAGFASGPVNDCRLAALSAGERTLLSQAAANAADARGGQPAVARTEREGEAAAVVHAHERILNLAEGAQQTTLDQIPKTQVLALPAPSQAVNLLDIERIALATPGAAVARARAWPDTDPALGGLHAVGVVTVVILPDMPVAQPTPSPGLLSAVERYLNRRRVLCTIIKTAAPTYVVIAVTAEVQATQGAALAALAAAIQAALKAYLDPLTGGPAGLGWPFGRSVYRAEILQLIANTPGVDFVVSMSLTADGGTPQCGDIALCPTYLLSSGQHQITVAAP